MANLIDLLGPERAMFLAAWMTLAFDDRMKRGLISGPSLEDHVEASREIVRRGIENGHARPTLEEIAYGINAMRAANPGFELTPRGKACGHFGAMQAGMGQG